jgi:hypothetical protein
MPWPPHPPWLDHSNYTWRRAKDKFCIGLIIVWSQLSVLISWIVGY